MGISPSRWNFQKLKEAFENPKLFLREAKRLPRYTKSVIKYELLRQLTQRYKNHYSDAVDIIEEDWDNLIIIDACRYDRFNKINTLDGELRQTTSIGSGTPEYVKRTLTGRKIQDICYVTSNGQIQRHTDGDEFHALISDVSNDPEKVTNAAKDAFERFPNKRIIVHYSQPHVPYIGPKAQKIRDQLLSEVTETFPFIHSSLLRMAEHGYVSDDKLLSIYDENLEIVLPHVSELIEHIPGKTVVTSDHGELLGERYLAMNCYDHHNNIYLPELRHVPWLEMPDGKRRKITSEPPVEYEQFDEEQLNERLRLLGYKN